MTIGWVEANPQAPSQTEERAVAWLMRIGGVFALLSGGLLVAGYTVLDSGVGTMVSQVDAPGYTGTRFLIFASLATMFAVGVTLLARRWWRGPFVAALVLSCWWTWSSTSVLWSSSGFDIPTEWRTIAWAGVAAAVALVLGSVVCVLRANDDRVDADDQFSPIEIGAASLGILAMVATWFYSSTHLSPGLASAGFSGVQMSQGQGKVWDFPPGAPLASQVLIALGPALVALVLVASLVLRHHGRSLLNASARRAVWLGASVGLVLELVHRGLSRGALNWPTEVTGSGADGGPLVEPLVGPALLVMVAAVAFVVAAWRASVVVDPVEGSSTGVEPNPFGPSSGPRVASDTCPDSVWAAPGGSPDTGIADRGAVSPGQT